MQLYIVKFFLSPYKRVTIKIKGYKKQVPKVKNFYMLVFTVDWRVTSTLSVGKQAKKTKKKHTHYPGWRIMCLLKKEIPIQNPSYFTIQ